MHDLARCAIAAGDRVVDGYVAGWADGTLTFGVEQGVVRALRIGNHVEILVFDDLRGEVRYSGCIDRVGATTVQISELELTSTLQRREVARVRIAQLCSGTVEPVDGAARPIRFVVIDIGAHGVRIATSAQLAEQDRITFEFPTRDRSVRLHAEVLRSQDTDDGSSRQFGCRFILLGEKDRDTLFRYVLQTQGAQRRVRLHS